MYRAAETDCEGEDGGWKKERRNMSKEKKKKEEDQRKNDRKREREFNDTSQRERGRRSQEYTEVTNYM